MVTNFIINIKLNINTKHNINKYINKINIKHLHINIITYNSFIKLITNGKATLNNDINDYQRLINGLYKQ